MKSDDVLNSKPMIIAADKKAAQIMPSAISPELAGFLELIGDALAQEWIEQNSRTTKCTTYDVCN
jgi:hypothetical protein